MKELLAANEELAKVENIIYALIWTAIAFAAAVVAGYRAGKYNGFIEGFRKSEESNNGWEDEAMWWRKNATSIAERDTRQHSS